MKLVRSWPSTLPTNRPYLSYVQDDLERLYMKDHDYALLADLGDDVLLIEWDMAVGREDLAAFIDRAAKTPDVPLVAAYRLYETASGAPRGRAVWAHRRYEGEHAMRNVNEGDDACHLFGFGLVYLPIALMRRFLHDFDGHVNDSSFSSWHYQHGPQPEVPIAWEVRPVHLHYNIAELAPKEGHK